MRSLSKDAHLKSFYFAHLHEAHAVQVLSDVVDDLASCHEDVSDVVVHDQIEVSLSVSDLDVGQTSIGSLGQHVKTG